jgi:hypothetical protein
MTTLAENLDRLEAAITAACHRAGRERGTVELMAVTKTCPAATIVEAAALGLTLFGENRVQEFAGKAAQIAVLRQLDLKTTKASIRAVGQGFSPDNKNAESSRALAPEASFSTSPIRVHLIGHLQSNKAARAVEIFDGIDSLDSLRLAERLNEAAGKLAKRLPVLIEVKLSPEESKSGLNPVSAEAAELLERMPDFEHLHVRGLMTIAPLDVPEVATRACFRELSKLRERWAAAHPRLRLDVLSMGMSEDFELAIEEGTTRIRIGTALFGERAAQRETA